MYINTYDVARFGDPRSIVSTVCGEEVFNKLGPVWGIDDEGELNSVWRQSGQEGLWFAIGELFVIISVSFECAKLMLNSRKSRFVSLLQYSIGIAYAFAFL